MIKILQGRTQKKQFKLFGMVLWEWYDTQIHTSREPPPNGTHAELIDFAAEMRALLEEDKKQKDNTKQAAARIAG